MQAESDKLGFVHRFVPAETAGRTPLLLLHGTGGSESDLIPLGVQLSPGAALLSPRGKISEHGAARFFRRRAEGVFDVEDLNVRTNELADFVEGAREAYGLQKPIAVGFSNGANIGWSLLFNRPAAISGAILMRAMLPFDLPSHPDLKNIPVLMLSGASDPIVPAETRDRLAQALKTAGADLQYEILPAGHQLTRQDLALADEWLRRR
jgi:phospholipase/carboxylesterase